jgi:iron complex outermembrane receptor protein
MTADAAAFRSTYRRLVEPTFVPSEFAFQFVNLTRARVRGIEITAAMETPSDGAGIRLGYTFLDARDLSADEPLVFRSRHLLKVGATSEAGPIQIGADLRIASAPERVDSDFARFVPDAHLMGPTRVVDLRAGTSWRSVRVMLHLKNALDYYYLERPALLAPPRHAIVQIAASL